jgi:lipopolysaccharide transport system permease protein
VSALSDILAYREVLRQLALREVRVRYKQTLLGVAWTVLQPLSLMALFTIVFTRFVRIPTEGYPYPVFVYSVLLPWQFMSASLTRATTSITGNSGLIQKVYVPREIFVLISLAPPLVDFAISLAVYGGLMAVFGVQPTLHVLWVPALLATAMLLVLGLGLWLATLNAFYRDASSALGLLLQLWFYSSPIIYPLSQVPDWLAPAYRWNPAVGVLEGFRSVLLRGQPPDAALLAISLAWAALLVFTGHALFRRAEGYFADVL